MATDPDWLLAISMRGDDRSRVVHIFRLLAGALEKAQYADNSGREYDPACAYCEKQIFREQDHAPDCKLALALAAYHSGVLPKGETGA